MLAKSFIIKQHSPLVHFLANQEPEPTLRATEVGSKLDKFLFEKWKKENNNDVIEVFKDYGKYIKGYTKAKAEGMINDIENEKDLEKKNKLVANLDTVWHLDYKLEIEVESINDNINVKTENINIINSKKKSVFTNNKIKLTFKTWHAKLEDEIAKHIEEFFILHSFGTRSNKGYGNFYLDGWETIKAKIPIGSFYKENFFKDNTSSNDIDKKIMDEYKKLKSGINFNEKYIKSKLFLYALENGMRWDKRWIKNGLKNLIDSKNLPNLKQEKKEPNDYFGNTINFRVDNGGEDKNTWDDVDQFKGKYAFVRIFLGLTEHWEFLTTDNNVKYRVKPVLVNANGFKLERFQSPLTFKVFDKHLYVLVNDIPKELFGKEFEFHIEEKQINDRKEKGKIGGSLSIPYNFNLKDFCDTVLPALGFTKKYKQ